MNEEEAIKRRFELVSGELNERTRRLVAASEAVVMGWGGISAVSRATGISRKAISHGIKELQERGGTPRHMMLERGAHSNWAKNARTLANGGKSRYD
jgi:hypothetical protein